MATRIEKIDDEPIVLIWIDPQDFAPENAQAFRHELAALLNNQPEPVMLINVLPDDYRSSMIDLIEAAQIVRQQSHLYRHPNIKGMIAVTTDEGLKVASAGLESEIFGGRSIRSFDTLEEALAFARSQSS